MSDKPDGARRPRTPPPRPLAPPAARSREEVDLAAVVGPAIAQRYGPVLLACAVTALVTWWAARRTR